MLAGDWDETISDRFQIIFNGKFTFRLDGFWLPVFGSKSKRVEEFSSHNLSQKQPILKSSTRKLHNQEWFGRYSYSVSSLKRWRIDFGVRLNIPSNQSCLQPCVTPIHDRTRIWSVIKFKQSQSLSIHEVKLIFNSRRCCNHCVHRRFFEARVCKATCLNVFRRSSSFGNEGNFVLRNCEARGKNNDFVDEKQRCFQSWKAFKSLGGVSRCVTSGFLVESDCGFSLLFFNLNFVIFAEFEALEHFNWVLCKMNGKFCRIS